MASTQASRDPLRGAAVKGRKAKLDTPTLRALGAQSGVQGLSPC